MCIPLHSRHLLFQGRVGVDVCYVTMGDLILPAMRTSKDPSNAPAREQGEIHHPIISRPSYEMRVRA